MAAAAVASRGLLSRLKAGLARTSDRLSGGITRIFRGRRVDPATIAELEELLIGADLGVATAARLAASLAREKIDRDVTVDDVRAALARDIAAILAPLARPLPIDPARKPTVILVVGVNGTGKTTTIGKLAKRLKDDGLVVHLAAGDTFRAAAIDQLKIWGERAGCPVLAREQGSDPAGLAYDALVQAKAAGADVLLIDTAGRLHNRTELMAELQKVLRVLRKLDPEAPHVRLLVLDATTGQNAHQQVETFRGMTEINGLVVTKLDGTAKGGVLVALAERFGLPVHFIGVGEAIEDLRPFEAQAFADALVGLDRSEAGGNP
ncbi:MAG: signal recognition particle-docking protein FtsY [Alphaproteobacteria bacterium]|nr:signal recognition particle-docking protein FtsY [Alphaproteobacteria bacterium]